MADLSITGGSVLKSTNATTRKGTAGAAVTGGAAVYLSTDNKLYLAQHDGTLAEAAAVGVALHAAGAGQPLEYLTGGNCTMGATVAIGEVYLVSATAGGIAPYADIGTGDYVTVLGIGSTTATMTVTINASGIQKA